MAPAAFDYYVVSDPSLWYDDGAIFGLSPVRPELARAAVGVLITSANPSREGPVASRLNMRANAERLAAELRIQLGDGATVSHLVFDGEVHESLFPVSVSHGLRRFLAR